MMKQLFSNRMWIIYVGALFLLPFLLQCKSSSDLTLPLAINSDTLHLDTAGGSTHIMIYSTGNWTAGFEKDTNWISINKTKGTGNSDVIFSYSKNYGLSRSIDFIINKGGLKKTIHIVQDGVPVQIKFSASKYNIPKQGLKTELPVISSIVGGYKFVKTEYLYDDETMEKWVSKGELNDSGFVFNSLDNNSGRSRSVRVYLTVVDADGVEQTAYCDINQSLTSAFLKEKYKTQSRLTKNAKIDTVILDGNVGTQFGSFDKKIIYKQGQDWIENVALMNDSLLLIAVKANTSGIERNADINLSLTLNGNKLINLTHQVYQSNSDFEDISFADLRAMIGGAFGTAKINASLKTLQGIVISDAGNANMETNNQTGFKYIDLDDTYKTAYIESEDGQYGFRLKFQTKADNILTRYSTVTISVDGLTISKEANPGRYTISGLTASKIVGVTAGAAASLPVKRLYIGQLTDNDMYTYVSLRDVSISVPYGSYMNINRGYSLKTSWNGAGTTSPYVDATPTNIFDGKGDNLNVLVNASAPWALSTLPQKSGLLSGIVTHSELVRYGGGQGNIGTYQIRPVNGQDIQLIGGSIGKTLVEWNWLTGGGTNTCATGLVVKDAAGKVTPLVGNGRLSCTVSEANATVGFNPVCHSDPNSKVVYNNGLQYTNVKWWDAATGTGQGFVLEFPTSGITAQHLVLNFTINGGSGADATNHIPTYWMIKYSTDGQSFLTLPNSTFVVRPLVQWNTDRPYETAGLTPYSFQLPTSLLGKDNVIIKIVAKSDICAAGGSSDSGESGHITAAMPGTTMRLGNVNIKYIQ